MAVLRDAGSGQDFPLARPRQLLGRGPDSDIRLGDPLVSSRHAQVTRAGDRYFIEDLGSRNGTFVNGQPVLGSTLLHPGDRLEVGGHQLLFLDEEAAPFALTETADPAVVVRSLDLGAGARTEVSPAAKLRAVLEISHNLGNTLRLEAMLPKILESLFALFPQADRGFIVLRDAQTGQLLPRAVRHRQSPTAGGAAISRTVLDYAVRTGCAVLSADAGHDDRFDASQSIRMHRIQSIMCVPLMGESGECLGVIQLDTHDRGRVFNQDDLDVLTVAGLQAARAVETARHHLELREMEAATQIQRSFLPGERPQVPGFQFFDHYVSAGQVGGDYYDYVPLPDGRLAVTVGDVAGKGVTAALLMARLSATARFCLATAPTPAAAVGQINAAVKRACGDGRFITLVAGVIDVRAHTITVTNAGHPPPLRRRADRTVEEVGAGVAGIPLGVFDRAYDEITVPVEPGDLFVLYSDGVSETRNPQGDLYGPERLRAVLRQVSTNATEAGEAILADVQRFADGRPPADDLTLVCICRED